MTAEDFVSISGDVDGAQLRMYEPNVSGSNYFELKAQAQSSNTTYLWPSAFPASNGYVLSSTTGGTMTWAALPTVSGATNQVAYFNGTNSVTSNSSFTYNGSQVGIGTTPSSSYRLYVKQSTTNDGILIERSSSSSAFRLYQDANSYVEGFGNMVIKTTAGTIALEPPGGSDYIQGVTIVPTAAKTDTFQGSTFFNIEGTYSPT